MPQMSPMMWLIFPYVMMVLVMVGVVILDEEMSVKSNLGDYSVSMNNYKW